MELAPIALFVYNRPWHTLQTLEALSKNDLADQSTLYIYADGPKPNATEEDKAKINEVRTLLLERNWCKEVIISEQKQNKGLANSIIEGVTEVVNRHGKIIVLEDDLLTATGFIKFMNDSLNGFQNKNLAGVSGWSFEIDVSDNAYLSRIGSCWGWGTWKDVWLNVNFNAIELINKIESLNLKQEFNADGNYPYFNMLVDQFNGKIDSWAIRFYAHYFIQQKLFLFPPKSLVFNIGKDGSGAHEGKSKSTTEKFEQKRKFAIDKDLPITEEKYIRNLIVSSSLYAKASNNHKMIDTVKRFKALIKRWRF